MSTRSTSTTAMAALAVGLAFLLTAQITWAKKPKPGKGGGNTPPLVSIAILPGGTIMSDDGGPYEDGRVEGVEGVEGVESFLFPSGNFGLRLEGSSRSMFLQFDPAEADGICPGGMIPPGYGSLSDELEVRELANVRIADLDNCVQPGLLCMGEDESNGRASGLYLIWDDQSAGQRFTLRMESGPNACTNDVWIVRTEGATPPSWTISADPGSRAWVSSQNLKGKPRTTIYGLIDVAFEIEVSCADPNCN